MLRTLGDLVLEGTSLRRPKPLLLLAYLALEGPKPRRYLAELLFGDAKDPNDSLSTALKYLRQHPASALNVQPKAVSTDVKYDVLMLFQELSEGRIAEAVSHYRGPFLSILDLSLGEELEDWIYQQQDAIAQRFRLAVMEYAEGQSGSKGAVRLIEQVWRLTKDQGAEASTLSRLYKCLAAGKSPLAQEVRRYAAEYGMPLYIPPSTPEGTAQTTPKDSLPGRVVGLKPRLEELRERNEGLALCLWGETGVGKSWTAEQVCQGLSFPFYSMPAALPAHLVPGRLSRAGGLPTWARTVLDHLSAAQPVAPVDAAVAIAEVLAVSAPVVLRVEDLHEANEDRLEFWTLLAQEVRRTSGVGLLATSRQPPPDSYDSKRLPALAKGEIKGLLEVEAGGTLPPDAVNWIDAHARGNPLFALEFYRLFRKRGNLWFDGENWRWRLPASSQIPDNLEALVSQSLRDLPLDGDARMFLWVKALMPAGTPDPLVTRVAGLDDERAGRAADTLSRQGVLTGLEFIHPLYREVQTAVLDRKTKARLAQRIVTALESDDPEGAAPFAADAGLPDEAACELLTQAAQEAFSRGRMGAAGEFFAQAADHTEGASRRALLLRAADCFKDSHTAQAQRLAERVLEAEPAHPEATLLLARCLVLQGGGERAETVIQRLPEAARPWRAWFEQLIHLRAERNDYQGVVSAWEAHPDLQGATSPEIKREVGVALVNAGRYSDADTLATKALEKVGLAPEDRAVLLKVRGLVACYTARFLESLTFFDEAITLLRQTDRASALPKLMRALRLRLTAYWALSRQHDAICDTKEAMQLASELGSGRDYAIAQAYLGVPLGELGNYEGAEAALLESREVLRRVDAREHLSSCEAILSGVYLNWQQPDTLPRALPYAHSALHLAEDVGVVTLVNSACFYVSWAELVLGDGEKALAYAERGLYDSRRIGRIRSTALFLWLRGLAQERLGRFQEALSDLDEAVALADDIALDAHKLHFLIDRDRLLDNREAVLQHIDRLERLGVVAFHIPARQRHLEMLSSIRDP